MTVTTDKGASTVGDVTTSVRDRIATLDWEQLTDALDHRA